MAAQIGPLTLKVGANADGMTPGLAKGGSTVTSWIGQMEAKFAKFSKVPSNSYASRAAANASALSDIASKAFANPVGAANQAIFGGAAGLLEKAPVIGSLLAAPLRAVQGGIDFALTTYGQSTERILNMGRQAARSGIAVDQFQVLSMVIGSGELAERAMFKFQRQLGQARIAAEGTVGPFEKLGLDGRKLAEMYDTDAVAAFGKVIEKIKAMGNASLMGDAAFKAFGRNGKEIMASFASGAMTIEKARGWIDKFGLGVNSALVQNVKQAEMAGRQVKMLWEGFSNQIVMATAPILATVAERVGNLPGGFKGLANGIFEVFEKVGMFIAQISDAFGDWEKLGEVFAPVWLDFKAGALDAIDFIGDALEKMIETKVKGSTAGRAWNAFLDTAVPGRIFTRDGMEAEKDVPKRKNDAAEKFRAEAAAKRKEAADRNAKLEELQKKYGANPEELERQKTSAFADLDKKFGGNPQELARQKKDALAELQKKFGGNREELERQKKSVFADLEKKHGGNPEELARQKKAKLEELEKKFGGNAEELERQKKAAGLDGMSNKWESRFGRFAADAKGKMLGLKNDLSAIDPWAPFAERARRLVEANKGPLDNFRDQFGEVAVLIKKQADMQAIEDKKAGGGKNLDSLFSKQNAALSAFKAFDALGSAHQEKKFTGASLDKTTEAYSDIIKDQFGDHNQTVQERLKLLTEEANAQRKLQIDIGQKLIDLYKANPGIIPRGE